MQKDLDKIVIIIPSLDPDEKCVKVLDDMRAGGFTRFVMVDDGSDADHKAPFEYARSLGYPVLVHEVNKGKGRALRDAFDYVYKNMPDIIGAITIDGDGQHKAEDALKLAEGLFREPGKVMMGCRDFSQSNVPTRNMLGNRITSLVFRLFCRIKLSDTQTGLRAFPYKYLKEFAEDISGERFEYETNMLLYMSEHGIEFTEIPIATVYIEENKSSHFHPIKDSFRIYKIIFQNSTILRQLVSSVIYTLVDIFVFAVMDHFFGNISPLILSMMLTTGVARIASFITNYLLGRYFVFKTSVGVGKSVSKLLVVASVHWVVSWLLLTWLTSLFNATGFFRVILKIFVVVLLFGFSYTLQKNWVFKEDKTSKE